MFSDYEVNVEKSKVPGFVPAVPTRFAVGASGLRRGTPAGVELIDLA